MESINRPIYRFFSFRTSERMASEYGHCSGQVNLQTGEILANISYGLFHYPETYQLNLLNSYDYSNIEEIESIADEYLQAA